MPPARRPRTWQPRPSPAAAARILAAIRSLIGDPDAPALQGYGVSPKQLAEHPGVGLTLTSLYGYLSALAAAGQLERISPGVYALPDANPR
jgi:hypothetical protein